ncbi:MAG: type II secretory pathway, component PulD, partial [Isosphaeraceae bacterium]|nr:type II secretory pathway, component PulD [Isosphaeraceae bacterium]
MGRLRSLTILLVLAAWGTATEGAPPDSASSSPSPAARPPAPVAPVKYLEAGAKLFNKQKYPLAAKYLKAANDYRDQLNESEQRVLDAYLEEMGKVPPEMMSGVATAPQPVVTATPSDTQVTPVSIAPAQAAAEKPAESRGPAGDNKQEARWKLQKAREMIRLGQYDDAAKSIDEVRAMDIKWGLFDETPAKLAEVLEKARPKGVAAAAVASLPKDKRMAKAKLQEARALLADQRYDQAEAIALDVKSWNLSYGLFDDNPTKVAAAARALRSRERQRSRGPKDQPSQGVYDLLVGESRKLMSAGKLTEAKQKALQAQRMHVVPPLSADRAEDVLQDIMIAQSHQAAGATVATGAEPASVASEREANELLARGDTQAAAAKLAESDKLRMQEQGQTVVALRGPTDPAVIRLEGTKGAELQPLPSSGGEPAQAAPASGRG